MTFREVFEAWKISIHAPREGGDSARQEVQA